MNQELPTWIAIAVAILIGYLIYVAGAKARDTRSSASESVEAGVVLPVASDRE